MSGWLYVAMCVVLPALWGVLMFFVFGALDRRRKRGLKQHPPPPIDYSI